MKRLGPLLTVVMLAAFAPTAPAGASDCTLCLDTDSQAPKKPLEVEVESGLDFSRFAQVGIGGGEASLDPQTGARTVSGNLVSLGGFAIQGHARIVGEPNAYVRVEMPSSVTLYSPSGAEVKLNDFKTDLPSIPVLDGNGTLEFNFGARLETSKGEGGDFRGRIPIRIEYN
jgi:hypothetical protein